MGLLFIKRPVLRLACHTSIGNLISRYYADQIPNRGCVIDTKCQAITPSVKASLYWGSYEKSEILFTKRYLKSDLDVIELGSSIGVVSSHIAKALSAAARLICVEANPELISSIHSNVCRNVPSCQLSVLQGAIDYSGAEAVTLSIGTRNIDSKISSAGKNLIEVPILTLQEICAKLDIKKFSLVADIEGAELGILRHEQALMERCCQLIIELHDTNNDGQLVTVSDMVANLVDGYGFRLLQRRGNVFAFER